MGRFYRTSNSTPVDYMYRNDTPLMAQVLGANDQYIDQQLEQGNKIGAFTFDYAPGDEAGANELMNNYHTQANNITDAISKDPANWRKQQGAIRDLTQKLQTDYTSGAINKYVTNYGLRKKAFDTLDQQQELYYKTGGVDKDGNPIGLSPEEVQKAKAYMDNNFNGSFNNGQYNPYKTLSLSNSVNVNKLVGDAVKNITKDKNTKEFTNIDGAYFDDEKHSWEGIPPEKILSVATNAVMTDPRVQNYIRDRSQIGYINNAYYPKGTVIDGKDVSGQFRTPYTVSPNGELTDEEKVKRDTEQHRINLLQRTHPKEAAIAQQNLNNQLKTISGRTKLDWDSGSFLAPYLQNAITQYGGTSVEDSQKYRNNSYANSLMVQGREDARQQRGFGHDVSMEGIKHLNRLSEMQEKAALKSKGEKKDGKGVTEATILAQPTNTPYGYLGTSKEDVESNLQSRLKNNNSSLISMYKSKHDAINNGDQDLANYISNQIQDKLADQMTLGQRMDRAKTDAVKEVVPESDMDLYNNQRKIQEDFYKFKTNLGVPDAQLYRTKEGQKYLVDNAKINRYNKAVDDKYKNNLLDATKEKTKGEFLVQTTDNDDKFLRSAINADPATFKIIDPNTGQETLSFRDGKLTGDDKDLQITGAGPTSSNSGTMNIYAKYKGKNIIITPTGKSADIVRNKLVGDWATSGDKGVKQLVSTWSSPYFSVVNQATNEIIQGDGDDPSKLSSTIYKTIDLPSGSAKIGITKVGTAGWKLEIESKDGWRTVPNIDEKGNIIGNYFASKADIVDVLNRGSKKQK